MWMIEIHLAKSGLPRFALALKQNRDHNTAQKEIRAHKRGIFIPLK
jgi:hypothetical protein